MAGRIYVISGPSGSGKSTIIQAVLKDARDLGYSISHTTRSPRGNEVDGVDYHFVSENTFRQMISKGDLLEWAEVYRGVYYGTSHSSVKAQAERGKDVIMDVDTVGAKNIKNNFKDAVLIYVIPPSLQALERRLKDRATDSDSSVKARMDKALSEIRECRIYDYIVVNEDLPEAVSRVKSIVTAERCRSFHLLEWLAKTFQIA